MIEWVGGWVRREGGEISHHDEHVKIGFDPNIEFNCACA